MPPLKLQGKPLPTIPGNMMAAAAAAASQNPAVTAADLFSYGSRMAAAAALSAQQHQHPHHPAASGMLNSRAFFKANNNFAISLEKLCK